MQEPTLDQNILNKWIERQETGTDVIEASQARLMQATLDQEPSLQNGDNLPYLWHWLYFPSMSKKSELGPDGHPELGGFMPPVALPRRQWAGSRLRFARPLQVGETATRTSTIKEIHLKQGRSGQLCFVTVEHVISSAGGEYCMTEEQDVVYREAPKPEDVDAVLPEAPVEYDWRELVEVDPVLLFRYSALTFNGHRIHYDRQYCHGVEGYAGLIVHGPLTATLLLNLALANRKDAKLNSFEFRAVGPLIDTKPFHIVGQEQTDEISLWAENHQNRLAVLAKAHFD